MFFLLADTWTGDDIGEYKRRGIVLFSSKYTVSHKNVPLCFKLQLLGDLFTIFVPVETGMNSLQFT